MNYTLSEIKIYLKELSTKIRIKKQLRKTVYGKLDHFDPEDVELVKSSRRYTEDYQREFRHLHIAYCLFRGRTIEQIEPKTEKKRNEDWIKDLKSKIENAMEELRNEREEDVRNCA